MKFSYSVIGDNIAENREWLEKVGYEELHVSNCPCRYLYSALEGYYLTSPILLTYAENNFINCIGNPQLFQAVSAISTKTDIGKHYINNHTGQWRQCTYEMATDENIDWNDWIEASLDELQEHFK